MNKPPLSEQAKGKWPSILPALGIDKDYLTGRHGPCPMCGGKDRFRFDNKDGRGSWFCSQCGAGDGIELVKRMNGWEFKQAAPEIEKHLGTASVTPIRMGRDPKEVRAEMNTIWRGAKPLEEVEATALYWARRIGDIPRSPNLRAVRSLRCPGTGDFPGMVAMIHGPDGKPANLHRTFLTPDGFKADIPEPRRVMDISLPRGSAVQLSEPGEVLGVAEGLETAESAHILFDVPTWALLNAGNMKGWKAPPGIRRVIVFGDSDASFTGQASAFELARSLWVRRKDWTPDLEIEVRINGVSIDATAVGQDWNNVLLARLAAEGQARMKVVDPQADERAA